MADVVLGGGVVVTQLIADLEPCISSARLHRYRPTGGTDVDVLVNYLWNMAISEALYCSLNAVEIALRNTIHSTLTHHFDTPDWYEHKGVLDGEQLRQVHNAKRKITRNGRSVTPDRVVGELSFGFWVTILSRNYDSRLWRSSRSTPLKQAFPRIPRRMRQRVTIHQRYNEIRELRNRVFHHEPLFDDHGLAQHHQEIYDAIHWINPEMRRTVSLIDRFPDVYENGRLLVEVKVKVRLDTLFE